MSVDIVVGPAPVGAPEVIEPANRLQLRRPLVTSPYRLFPVVDQIAEKVCATMYTDYPGGRRSSRVKDLVDLVVLVHSQRVDLGELRAAITTKQATSGTAPFAHFDVPADWRRTYRATARGVPSAQAYSAEAAATLVARFLAPALAKNSNTGTWDPQNLRWRATGELPGTHSSD